MGLTRSSSGLLVRDEFGSDSSANYNVYSTNTLAVSGGVAAITAQGPALNTTVGGAKCVTAKGKRSASGTRINGPLLNMNNTVETSNDVDGYGVGNSTNWSLNRYDNGAGTRLGTSSSGVPSAGNWAVARVYLTATGVVGRFGTTALSYSISASDTAHTGTGYGGFTGYGESGLQSDDLDVRTSHLIICSGLPTGYYLKVSDGTTTAKAVESSGTATVDAGAVLFPLATVGVYDGDPDSGGTLVVELDTGDYADMGGGDAFVYAAAGPVTMLTTVAEAGAQGLTCSVGMRKIVDAQVADAGADGLMLLVVAAVTVDVAPAGAGAESPPWLATAGPVIDVAPADAGAHGLIAEIQAAALITTLLSSAGADGLVMDVSVGVASVTILASIGEAGAQGLLLQAGEVVSGLRRTYPAMVRTYPPLCRAA
jgi:hypothetical protein